VTWSDLLLVAGGLVAGFFSGTIGIGGGVLFVPTMTVFFRLSQAAAQGTSLLAIVPTAIVGGFTHLREGNVQVQPALWMGGGGLVGAIIGALVAVEVPGPILARVWGAFLVLFAVRLGAQAIRKPSSTP
jgi:uncharacterized membrane protein YfcA